MGGNFDRGNLLPSSSIYVLITGWDSCVSQVYRNVCVSKATFVFLKRVIFKK